MANKKYVPNNMNHTLEGENLVGIGSRDNDTFIITKNTPDGVVIKAGNLRSYNWDNWIYVHLS